MSTDNELTSLVESHLKHPQFEGEVTNPTVTFTGVNSLCGDQIVFTAHIESEEIKELRFRARGCVISRASASVLSEMVNGLTIAQAMELNTSSIDSRLGTIIPIRQKCAYLSLYILHEGLKGYKNDGTSIASVEL